LASLSLAVSLKSLAIANSHFVGKLHKLTPLTTSANTIFLKRGWLVLLSVICGYTSLPNWQIDWLSSWQEFNELTANEQRQAVCQNGSH